MKAIARLFVFCVLGITASNSWAGQGPDPLFAAHDTLIATLNAPLRQLARDSAEEPEYLPGSFGYLDAAGNERVFDVRVRPRGKSRRDRQVCRFPPLRLNFEKKQVKGTLFDGQNVLKLVTHCQRSENFQNYVLREYLTYRMLNELTDASFRVRLLKITYTDSERNAKPYERYAFLIEHKRRLADRLGMEVAEPVSISAQQLAAQSASVAELFQFMISNTDYSFIAAPPGETCCHNAILLRTETAPDDSLATTAVDAEYVPVPYDFDRTGMVDPPNALPDENLGQKNVRDRLYRGFCRDSRLQAAAIEQTLAKRADFEGLINNQADLSRANRQEMLRFLDAYYQIVERPSLRDRKLKCRPPL